MTTSAMIGQRETKTNGANLCRNSSSICQKEASATKDGNLQETDGSCNHHSVHNGTFPAFAHSNTHAVTYSLFFLRGLSHQSSRIDNDLAFCLCVLKEVIRSRSDLHPSLASADTFIHYTNTMNTDTTLDGDDGQATVTNCKNPSTHPLKKQVWPFCRISLSFTQYFNYFLDSPVFLNVPCFRPTSIGQLMCQPMPRIP